MSEEPSGKNRDRKSTGKAIQDWWFLSLGGHFDHDNGAARAAHADEEAKQQHEQSNGAARAARARLRRASSPAEVLSLGVTHDLYHAIRNAKEQRDLRHGDDGPVRLALIASVLASVETHDGRSRLARLFGPATREERPALSPLRFQRLLRAPNDWALAVALRRALPLVGRTANVAALGEDLLFWGGSVRNRWCFEYFGTAPPERPEPSPTHDETENA